MKRQLIKSCALLLLLLAAMPFFSSCKNTSAEKRLEYAKSRFCAKISGKVNENEVYATLYSDPEAENGAARATLVFSQPKGLEGIAVTLFANGECGVRIGDSTLSADRAHDILKPYFPVFSVGEVYSSESLGNGGERIRVCDENCDLIYTFEENSDYPHRIQGVYFGNNIDFLIEDFAFNFDFQK